MFARPDRAHAKDIVVFTDFTSPYQVELFDKVEELAPGRIEVYYRKSRSDFRGWSQPSLRHSGVMLDSDPGALDRAAVEFAESRLAVFNFYDDRRALRFLNARAKQNRPWCFWGERPGFYSPLLGRIRRKWSLRWLHNTDAPIWGMGRLAVDAYRDEFGSSRQYVNFPYFSDLERFSKAARSRVARASRERAVLFSGSLSRRKGVDLLAKAFARLFASGERGLRLKILGSGPLERSLRDTLVECKSHVEFLGFKDWDALPQVYADADMLCAPSRHDGWGLIVPEALASGLPVISTGQTGAAVEFLKPGVNGWLVDASRPDTLLEALREAVAVDGTRLARMSSSSVDSVAGQTLAEGARRFLLAADQAVSDWKG